MLDFAFYETEQNSPQRFIIFFLENWLDAENHAIDRVGLFFG